MGSSSTKQKPLQVATLNFGGITHSPFEFYSGTQEQEAELKRLSDIFAFLYEEEKKYIANTVKIVQNKNDPNSFSKSLDKLKISNIDKIMQRERYSPLYRRDAGILNGHLMKRQEFQTKWEQQFQKNKHYVSFVREPTPSQKYQCRVFDYLIYKTIVEYIYVSGKLSQGNENDSQPIIKFQLQREDRHNIKSLSQEEQKRLRKIAVIKYQEILDFYFSKPYLKLQNKVKSLNKIVEKNDVLFLQDASDQLVNALRNEGNINIITIQKSDCAILLKQEKFETLYDQKKIFQKQKDFHPSNFNYDPQKKDQIQAVICFVDDFLLINFHLGQIKKLKPFQKILKVMSHLISLKNKYELLHIIAGGDFNTFFITKQFKQKGQISQSQREVLDHFYERFNVYPSIQDHQEVFTTKKKRTNLQPQKDKAEILDQSCVDFLISSLPMEHQRISQLGQIIPLQKIRMLTQEHPFDHLIVSAAIKR